MSYLSPDDLFNAAKVSQYWRKLAEDEPLWNVRSILLTLFISINE